MVKPARAMFLFALPMIIGNLFQQFYNMADSIIVGNFVGEDALAAVGASYSFTTVFIMVAIGGGMGSTVLVSQYFGAKKYGEMKTAINTFLLTFFTVGILLAVIGFLVNPLVLQALKTPDNIYNDAVLYLQIYFVGLPLGRAGCGSCHCDCAGGIVGDFFCFAKALFKNFSNRGKSQKV